MAEQRSLFDEPDEVPTTRAPAPALERFEGAMVFSAVGDALGWPTEFLQENPRRKPPFELPLRSFVRWRKVVGGRWWGYPDEIRPGEYSDDTQLTLAVCRSISSSGSFQPDRFAYEELPLWLHYQRGGGRSIKTAARTLIRGKRDWQRNFYRQGPLDYRQAGANGAAMRNLPIALASVADEKRLIRDSFFNAIITHGHPRGILGAILFGLAVRHAATQTNSDDFGMAKYLHEGISMTDAFLSSDPSVMGWVEALERRGRPREDSLPAMFSGTYEEAHTYLRAVQEFDQRSARDYYRFVGALSPATKGSGLATVCAAVFLFNRYEEEPDKGIYEAVNLLGSDTDTVASFLGALLGARLGLDAVPAHLRENVQDREYLLKAARRLRAVAAGEPSEKSETRDRLRREEAYLRILAWEIGLHEMFWDAIDVGGVIAHPTLGKGTIVSKDVRSIRREGWVAKLLRVKFDCGQTCLFHSRVEHGEKVSESLARDIESGLAAG